MEKTFLVRTINSKGDFMFDLKVSTIWKTLLLSSVTNGGLEIKISSNLFKNGHDNFDLPENLKLKVSKLDENLLLYDFNHLCRTYGLESDSQRLSQPEDKTKVDIEAQMRGILTAAQKKISVLEGDDQQQNAKLKEVEYKLKELIHSLKV